MADYSGHDPEAPTPAPERGGSVDAVPVANLTAAAALDAVRHHPPEPELLQTGPDGIARPRSAYDEEGQLADPPPADWETLPQHEPSGRVIVSDRDGDRWLADDVPGADFRFVGIGGPRHSWHELATMYGPLRVVDDGATLPPLPGPPFVPGELVELERVAGPPMGPYECLVELAGMIKDLNVREVERLGAVVAGLAPFTQWAPLVEIGDAQVTDGTHQVGGDR